MSVQDIQEYDAKQKNNSGNKMKMGVVVKCRSLMHVTEKGSNKEPWLLCHEKGR